MTRRRLGRAAERPLAFCPCTVSTTLGMLHPAGSPGPLKQRGRQVEGVLRVQLTELLEQRLQLQAAMRRCERGQPADSFCQLALGADPPSPAGLVPGDGDVDEALEEVALVRRSCAPGRFELFVRGEVLAGTDQLDAFFKRGFEPLRLPPGRRRSGAGSRGRTRSGRCERRTATRARDT